MIPFADSSALVKLYADEDGQDLIRAFDRFVVAEIARVEVPAALWAKQRSGSLSRRSAELLVNQFAIDWFGADGVRRFEPVRMTSLILEDAARSSGVHGLRGYDAVQLASARAVRAADATIASVAAFDTALRAAAGLEGFALVP